MITTSKMVAAKIPHGPTQLSARTPIKVAETSWQIKTSNSTGFKKRSGRSTSLTSATEPLRWSSAKDLALIREVRTSAVSANAKRPEIIKRTTTTTLKTISAPSETLASITPTQILWKTAPEVAVLWLPSFRLQNRPRGPSPRGAAPRGRPRERVLDPRSPHGRQRFAQPRLDR